VEEVSETEAHELGDLRAGVLHGLFGVKYDVDGLVKCYLGVLITVIINTG
jgi:hypothetical protein